MPAERTQKHIPVHWPLNHDLPTLTANHFAIALSGDLVYLTFGEVRPPILPDEPSESLKQLAEEGLTVKPISSIVVSPVGLKALVNMIVNSLSPEDLRELEDHIHSLLQPSEE